MTLKQKVEEILDNFRNELEGMGMDGNLVSEMIDQATSSLFQAFRGSIPEKAQKNNPPYDDVHNCGYVDGFNSAIEEMERKINE